MNPVWSADGEWIYFGRGSEPQDETEIDVWRLRPGRIARARDDAAPGDQFPVAARSTRTLLYVARAEDRSGPWLWSLDVESGVSRRVPTGVDQYTSVSTSRDGRRIVATVANPSASLWQVPLLDRPAEEADAHPYPLPDPTGMALAPRFGAAALFYLSARGMGDGLWKVEGGTASQVRPSVNGAMSEPAAVSAGRSGGGGGQTGGHAASVRSCPPTAPTREHWRRQSTSKERPARVPPTGRLMAHES